MPNPGAERPLRKVTLNLFENDVADAEILLGQGWSVQLRAVWHEYIRKLSGTKYHTIKRTLGDLE